MICHEILTHFKKSLAHSLAPPAGAKTGVPQAQGPGSAGEVSVTFSTL